MVVGGGWFMCVDFGFLPRGEKSKDVGNVMPFKKERPLLVSLLGPAVFFIGVRQILRQFHILG